MGISKRLPKNELLPTPRAGNPGSRPNGKGGKILAEEVKKLTSSQEDSHARVSHTQVNEKEQQITVGSGQRCLELYPPSSQLGSLVKTCLVSPQWQSNKRRLTWTILPIMEKQKILKMEQQGLFGESLVTSKKSDTMSSAFCYRLLASELPTYENEYSLLGTPTARTILRSKKFAKGRTPNPQELLEKMNDAMLPTPTVVNPKGSEGRYEKRKAYRESIGRNYVAGGLNEHLQMAIEILPTMLPTPTTLDFGTPRNPRLKKDSNRDPNLPGSYRGDLKDILHLQLNNKLLPTPSVMDTRTDIRKPEERSEKANKGGCSNLRERMAEYLTPTGQKSAGEETQSKSPESYVLKPEFTEWMMGYPQHWTDLNFPTKDIVMLGSKV